MPTKIGATTSDLLEDATRQMNMASSSKKPKKSLRLTEKLDIKQIEKRFADYNTGSRGLNKRQSVALALESLRIVYDSSDDITSAIDLDNASVGEDGRSTRGSRLRHWLEVMVRPWANNPVALAHFRSSQSMRNEQLRQRRTNRFIIHPYSLFRVIWDILMILVLMATIIVLPIEVAFYSTDLWDPTWKGFNLIVDAVFLIDIAINMRTAYVNNPVDNVILDGKLIIKAYLKTWFVIDLVSSLPIDYIVLSLTGEMGNPVLGATLRALRMVKFISLLRILRFIRLIRYLSRMKEFMHIDAKILSILRLVMSILIFAHWNACIQYLIIFIQGVPENSWLRIAELHHDNVTRWSIYSHAVYRGMSHMISIGYGKSPPVGNSETWTVVISMMMGATFYAMFIAHVSAIVMSLDASGRHFQEKLCEVKDYMRYRRLPANLQQRVVDYYEYKYQQKFFDEHNILDERYLSYPLRKEIVMHNCRSLVQSVPFLRNSPSEFLVDVILKLSMHVYFPGDHIVQAGKKGDSMYFIEHGMVNIILSHGEVVNTLRDGSHFGEVSLLFDAKRIADVAAVETSYIYRLAKSDFDHVLGEYPNMRQEMMTTAKQRLEQTQAKMGYNYTVSDELKDDNNEDDDEEAHITSSEEAWIMEEEGGTEKEDSNDNISNNNNNNNNNNGSNSSSPGCNTNTSSREDSRLEYIDCKTGEENSLGPMVMDVIEDESDDGNGGGIFHSQLSAACTTSKDKGRRNNAAPSNTTLDREAWECVHSLVDQIVINQNNEVSPSGLRRRHMYSDPSLPDVSI